VRTESKFLDLCALNVCIKAERWGDETEGLNIKLIDNGWWLLRNGAKHDLYTNGIYSEPIPRHREVDEKLARAIIKRQGLK